MYIDKVYEDLEKIVDSSKVLKNEPMKKYTSFKIGGNADILVNAETIEDINNILKYASKNNVPLYIIGNGSNILVKDKGIRGIVLKICIDKLEIYKKEEKAIINVGAGVKLAKLAQELYKKEIAGFEFAARNSWYHRRSS
mgnify:CR=1 FL=1